MNMDIKDSLPKTVRTWSNEKLVNKLEAEVFNFGRYGKDNTTSTIIDIEEHEILCRMNMTTALICNIMSTVACAISEDSVDKGAEHLRYLLDSDYSFAHSADVDAIVSHFRDIVHLNTAKV